MAYKILNGDKEQLERALNGTVVIGPYPNEGLSVGGRTLIFTTPVATTVTFSGAVGAVLSLDLIVSEINAVVAGFAVKGPLQVAPQQTNRDGDGKVVPKLYLSFTRAAGFTIGNAGTANPYFGFTTLTGPAEVTSTDILGFTAYQTQYTALIQV